MMNLNEAWEKIEQTIKITAKEVLGYVSKKTKKTGLTTNVKLLKRKKTKYEQKFYRNLVKKIKGF